MKCKSKLALMLTIYCFINIFYPVSASPLEQDPLAPVIKQVLEATFNDLGLDPSPNWEESTPFLSGNVYLYDSSYVSEINILHYLDINDATNSLIIDNSNTDYPCTRFIFHGYPAKICEDIPYESGDGNFISSLANILDLFFSVIFKLVIWFFIVMVLLVHLQNRISRFCTATS